MSCRAQSRHNTKSNHSHEMLKRVQHDAGAPFPFGVLTRYKVQLRNLRKRVSFRTVGLSLPLSADRRSRNRSEKSQKGLKISQSSFHSLFRNDISGACYFNLVSMVSTALDLTISKAIKNPNSQEFGFFHIQCL